MKKLLAKSNLSRPFSMALFAAALVFAVFILWREGSKVPWDQFYLNPGLIILSIAISSLGFIPALLAWRTILRVYHIHNSWQDDVQNYIYAMLGSILPGGIWQLVGRSALYKKQDISSLRITAASALEIIIIALGGMVLYLVGLLIRPELSFVKWPGFPYLIMVLVLILLEPHLIGKVNHWVLRKSHSGDVSTLVQPTVLDTFLLFMLEMVTLSIGGTAIFVLLRSLYAIEIYNLVNVIAAYSFSVAFANLFFWLPGRMVLKDSAMALALAQSTPVGMAVIFVVLIRLWSIFTILIPVGSLWILIYLFRYFRRQVRKAA